MNDCSIDPCDPSDFSYVSPIFYENRRMYVLNIFLGYYSCGHAMSMIIFLVLWGVDVSLHLQLPSMNRLNQTKPATFCNFVFGLSLVFFLYFWYFLIFVYSLIHRLTVTEGDTKFFYTALKRHYLLSSIANTFS